MMSHTLGEENRHQAMRLLLEDEDRDLYWNNVYFRTTVDHIVANVLPMILAGARLHAEEYQAAVEAAIEAMT